MKSKIISLASIVIALGSVFMAAFFPRLARSLRKRGLQTTISLFIIKVKLTIDLFLPRTIWGERVGLRPINQSLTRAEVERVYKWSCDREILRWSAGSPTELNFDEFSDQLKRQRWHLQLNQRVFYIVLPTGELIGKIGLYSIDWMLKQGELGIFLDQMYWGKQYGRDAIKILVKYAFTKTPLTRIFLGTFKQNLRAQRSFAACGFNLIGTADRYNPIVEKNEEGVVMEILRGDFNISSKY
jgi:RimJ/RimL family protein N-acetyltransferase